MSKSDLTPKPTVAASVFDPARLATDAKIGMSKVDPMDIRPPSVLMCQALSDKELFTNLDGKTAEVGEFFHTGRGEIMESFECYFVFAGKSKAVNKNKPEEGEKPIYRAIGCMADDLTPFAMTFRSSSLYCLSPLFTATVAQKRPMYSLLCKLEKRDVHGEKRTWPVPALRVVGPENDEAKLAVLYDLAMRLDQNADAVAEDDLDDTPPHSDADRPY